MADAGRVIAGTARGIRLAAPGPRRPGRSATGSSRRSSRSSSPTCRARASSTCSPAAGAAGIEALSRGAAHATFVERDAGAGRGHRGQPRAHAPRRRAGTDRPRRRPRLAARARRRGRRAVRRRRRSTRRTPRPALLADGRSRAVGPLLAPGGRVVAKHFWRDPPPAEVGLLASERERRFGETALTFYRRQEDR